MRDKIGETPVIIGQVFLTLSDKWRADTLIPGHYKYGQNEIFSSHWFFSVDLYIEKCSLRCDWK